MSSVDPKLIAALSKMGAVKKEVKESKPALQFLGELFPLQKQIIEHPGKRQALLAGRRASKSYTISAKLLKTALENSNSNSLFISLTSDNARRIIWNYLKKFNEDYFLGGTFNESNRILSFENGSSIQVVGCPDIASAERFRGAAYHCVCIDEAGAFADILEYLIKEIIGPALADHDGDLWLAGTPNRQCVGYFYEVTTKPSNFKLWQFTVFDNEKFPVWSGKDNWQELSQQWWPEYLKSEGLLETSNSVQREYYARWVKDTDMLVIDLEESRNLCDETDLPPEENRKHIIGVDMGFNDPFAIVIGCYSSLIEFPYLYILDVFERDKVLFDEKTEILNKADIKYNPTTIVCDPGAGKDFIEQYNVKYKMNVDVLSAKKTEKVVYADLLSDDCVMGKVKFLRHLYPHFTVMKGLVWDDKDKGDMPSGAPDHVYDAFKYLWRAYSPLESRKYKHNTPKSHKELHVEAVQQHMRKMDRQRRRSGI